MIWLTLFILGCVGYGFFDAVMDKLQFHYHKAVFNRFDNQDFWDPNLSWRRKWKNGNPKDGERFFLSSTLFVFTTDAWHLAKFFRNLFVLVAFIGIGLYGQGIVWVVIGGRFLWGAAFKYTFEDLLAN
jgi:hypothetical protein